MQKLVAGGHTCACKCGRMVDDTFVYPSAGPTPAYQQTLPRERRYFHNYDVFYEYCVAWTTDWLDTPYENTAELNHDLEVKLSFIVEECSRPMYEGTSGITGWIEDGLRMIKTSQGSDATTTDALKTAFLRLNKEARYGDGSLYACKEIAEGALWERPDINKRRKI